MNNPELHKLVKAVKRADLSSIASLCQSGIDVDQLTEHGQTPLCIAAIKGNTKVIRALIDAGADVNKASGIGFSPLEESIR